MCIIIAVVVVVVIVVVVGELTSLLHFLMHCLKFLMLSLWEHRTGIVGRQVNFLQEKLVLLSKCINITNLE